MLISQLHYKLSFCLQMDTRARIQQNDLLLHEAVIKNEPAAVREALERPTDVNCRNNVSVILIH